MNKSGYKRTPLKIRQVFFFLCFKMQSALDYYSNYKNKLFLILVIITLNSYNHLHVQTQCPAVHSVSSDRLIITITILRNISPIALHITLHCLTHDSIMSVSTTDVPAQSLQSLSPIDMRELGCVHLALAVFLATLHITHTLICLPSCPAFIKALYYALQFSNFCTVFYELVWPITSPSDLLRICVEEIVFRVLELYVYDFVTTDN